MKILFVAPYPIDKAPSQRFRFEQYFPFLEEAGFQYKLVSFWSNRGWHILYKRGRLIEKTIQLIWGLVRRSFLLFNVSGYDRIFIHREMSPVGPPIFEWIVVKVLRKKVIYDFDDAIWMENTSEENKLAARIKYHSKVSSICSWSWKVSCGNAWLASFAKRFNGHVQIVPTTVDLNYHSRSAQKNPQRQVTIGWTGTHSTAKYLSMLQPVLETLSQKFQFDFLVISNQKPEIEIPNLIFEPWDRGCEIEQLQIMDIGVMPLEDHEWEKGKCGFKALQYMAVGIPAVVAPVGVNAEIVDQGINGFHCQTHAEWVEALSKLIQDTDLRNKMGQAGLEKIEKKYSNQANKDKFLRLFELPEHSQQ